MNTPTDEPESVSPAPPDNGQPIASRLHTLIVIAAVAAWAYVGALTAGQNGSELHPHRIRLYLISIGGEWLMFALILFGVWRAGTPLRRVVGERWRSARELARDVGIAAAFWVAAAIALYVLRMLLGATSVGPDVLALLPRTAVEISLWIVLSVSAGICEETVFRGYLQPQLMALSGNRAAGMLLAAAAFGLAHLYQGWRLAAVIALYGLMFGALAYLRRSVRPGMIAHAWQDILSGILGSMMLRH